MADTAEQIQELVVRYPRIEDAIKAAMIDALRKGADHKEWGGAVFQRGNEFYATAPQTSGQTAHVDIRATADQPGDHSVAVYHTHPIGRDSGRFSPDDVAQAKAFGKPMFVGVEGGDTLTFDPKTDRADALDPRRRNDPGAGSARGRVFLPRELLAQALRTANNQSPTNVPVP